MQLEMTHNGKFGQKSGLDWVKMAIFAYFSIFSPKMRLRLTGNCQFHLIHNFSHLLPPKHLIFGEISKIFISGGGGTSANFLTFPTFSNCFSPMRLEMTHNGKFGQKSGLDWVKMAIFAYFSIFSPKMRLRLLEMVNFTWFTTFPIFCHQSILFLEKSQKFSFLGWGTSAYFLSFPTFSNCFTPMRLKMTHNGKFGQKSGLDCVKTAIFAYFSIFSPKMRLRLTGNCQFHLIHNFSHLLPPKHLIFGEISKIFISGGGGTSANFLIFPTFSNCFSPMRLEMTHNGKFGQKSGLDWVKMAIFAYFSIFSPKMRLTLLEMVNFTWFTTFPIFYHQSVLFLEKSQKFSFLGGTSAYFLSFPTFSNRFTPMRLKMTHNGKFGQKSGLDWVKTAIFAYFSIFSPKMRLRLTRNGQFHLIHNFSHLLPPKHLIFVEISKIFILGGVTNPMEMVLSVYNK